MDDSAAQPVFQPSVDAHVAPSSAVPRSANHAAQSASESASSEDLEASRTQSTFGPGDPMITFAYTCLKREFEALLTHQPKAGELPTPENVHQMRIATRRLRSALRMFEHMLPHKAGEHLAKNLRWFARALGDVRDLDVYAENFCTYLQEIPPERLEELRGYELHLRRARTEARDKLGELFADERYSALLAAFAELLDGAPSRGALRRWRSFRVQDGARKYLCKSLKRVRKLGREMARNANARELHRLRIRAKRLRYELEFFTPIYPELRLAAKSTKALQDMLGEHQDAYTATARLRNYARLLRSRGTPATAVPSALGDLLQGQQRKAAEARKAFAAEWRKFEHTVASVHLHA